MSYAQRSIPKLYEHGRRASPVTTSEFDVSTTRGFDPLRRRFVTHPHTRPSPSPAADVSCSAPSVGVSRRHQYRDWRGGVWPGAGAFTGAFWPGPHVSPCTFFPKTRPRFHGPWAATANRYGSNCRFALGRPRARKKVQKSYMLQCRGVNASTSSQRKTDAATGAASGTGNTQPNHYTPVKYSNTPRQNRNHNARRT